MCSTFPHNFTQGRLKELRVEVWVNLLQTFGLAVVILLAIGVAIWKGAGWVGRELIIPLRDKLLNRLVAFFDKMDDAVERLTTTLGKVDQNVGTMLGLMNCHTGFLRQQAEKTTEAAEAVKKVVVAETSGHAEHHR